MSQLKAHLDKNVKLEPVEGNRGETTAGNAPTITIPTQVSAFLRSFRVYVCRSQLHTNNL